MKHIENLTLSEVKVDLVEESSREEYNPEKLPEVEAKLEYDPSNLIDHAGVCYIFYPNEEIKNLVLRSRKVGKNTLYDLVSREGRPFLEGKNVRMITAISPEKIAKALELITAPATPANKRKLTEFIMKLNRNKPASGLHLVYGFTLNTQTEGSLGYVSPAVRSIDYRRGQNGI